MAKAQNKTNAGRKPGPGKYGEATEPRRIPLSLLPETDQKLRLAEEAANKKTNEEEMNEQNST